MCPFCSATFHFEVSDGHKEIFNDHYIVPNILDSAAVKELALEWLRRLHHKPGVVDKEFYVVDVKGFSLPFWVVSLEAHTAWKGLVRRDKSSLVSQAGGNEFLLETGEFRRGYRWAVSARTNICETWGLTRLHEPPEPIEVEWDGYPLDSTFSRGRLVDEVQKSAYEARNVFDFKYANGLPILGVQVEEDEGLRRARNHADLYHYKLARLNVDYLIDHRTEIEIAGIQLLHLPLWQVNYVYRPRNLLRHFYHGKENRLILDGNGRGILNGELAMIHRDKITINGYVTGAAGLLFFILSLIWHPAFLFVAMFSLGVAGLSFYKSAQKKAAEEDQRLEAISQSFGQTSGQWQPDQAPSASN
jgi:hypothetical protein